LLISNLIIYITPPKRILKNEEILFDLGFVTNGKMNVSTNNVKISDEILESFLVSSKEGQEQIGQEGL